jgi:hypothetical protein
MKTTESRQIDQRNEFADALFAIDGKNNWNRDECVFWYGNYHSSPCGAKGCLNGSDGAQVGLLQVSRSGVCKF